jgi:hypothetical protein
MYIYILLKKLSHCPFNNALPPPPPLKLLKLCVNLKKLRILSLVKDLLADVLKFSGASQPELIVCTRGLGWGGGGRGLQSFVV